MNEPLKTATAIVGLLAGVVAAVYVLGGLVIALRMLFDAFSLNSAVTIVGQLPRELVISTAMLNVLLPAATVGLAFGLIAALVVGLWGSPLSTSSGTSISGRIGRKAIFLIVLVTLALVAPAIVHAYQTDGWSPGLLTSLAGIVATFAAAYAGWYGLRYVATAGLPTGAKFGAAGLIAATVALTPAVMFASSLSFENAQVCVAGDAAPVKGKLIGEGGGQVLIEQHFGRESGVISLPSDKVTKTEYGDIVTNVVCPGTAEAGAKAAEAKLGGHGSPLEVGLATRLRPRLRFDSHERWRPLRVETLLAEDHDRLGPHRLCYGIVRPDCRFEKDFAVLKRGDGAPDFIDIAGSEEDGADARSPRGDCLIDYPAVDCNEGEEAVIYYRRTTYEGRWYWDYWWFFRYSDYNGQFNDCKYYCGDHEGDWEGVTVITTPSLRPEILGTIYAAHKERILVDASALPRSGNHPLVFVANGTHASYPFRCAEKACRQYGSLVGFRLPEEGHDGEAAWGVNVDASCREHGCVRALPEVGKPGDLALPLAGEWAGWTGKWGRTCVQKCSRAESSPSSPGVQIRFRCPWAPTHWAVLSPDGTVSKAERAGDAERLRAGCEAQRAGL